MVLTGDVTQIDLPHKTDSGLEKCASIVGSIDGISVIRLNNRDVVRNKIVKEIVKAFEKAEAEKKGIQERQRKDVTIHIDYETKIKLEFDYQTIIHRVINGSCDFIQCPYETEVNVILTDNASIQEINKEQRGIDAPTDVLSFPMIGIRNCGRLCIFRA